MHPTIHIRDDLALEAHLDTDEPHVLPRREGEPGAVWVVLATCAGLDGGREAGCKNAWVDVVKKQ